MKTSVCSKGSQAEATEQSEEGKGREGHGAQKRETRVKTESNWEERRERKGGRESKKRGEKYGRKERGKDRVANRLIQT